MVLRNWIIKVSKYAFIFVTLLSLLCYFVTFDIFVTLVILRIRRIAAFSLGGTFETNLMVCRMDYLFCLKILVVILDFLFCSPPLEIKTKKSSESECRVSNASRKNGGAQKSELLAAYQCSLHWQPMVLQLANALLNHITSASWLKNVAEQKE